MQAKSRPDDGTELNQEQRERQYLTHPASLSAAGAQSKYGGAFCKDRAESAPAPARLEAARIQGESRTIPQNGAEFQVLVVDSQNRQGGFIKQVTYDPHNQDYCT